MKEEDLYSKEDIIYTRPFGLVLIVKRLRDVKGTVWYVVHTSSGSEFQVQHSYAKRLATDAEANAFRKKMNA